MNKRQVEKAHSNHILYDHTPRLVCQVCSWCQRRFSNLFLWLLCIAGDAPEWRVGHGPWRLQESWSRFNSCSFLWIHVLNMYFLFVLSVKIFPFWGLKKQTDVLKIQQMSNFGYKGYILLNKGFFNSHQYLWLYRVIFNESSKLSD